MPFQAIPCLQHSLECARLTYACPASSLLFLLMASLHGAVNVYRRRCCAEAYAHASRRAVNQHSLVSGPDRRTRKPSAQQLQKHASDGRQWNRHYGAMLKAGHTPARLAGTPYGSAFDIDVLCMLVAHYSSCSGRSQGRL